MPDLNKAYQWAVNTCNAPNIGYNQDYRNQGTVRGITYYDCSSFISYALLNGGWDVYGQAYTTATGSRYSGNAITTANEQKWLEALGFQKQPITGIWVAGDIIWRSGHTEMVYSGGTAKGVTMGAHSSKYALDRQVSINNFESTASNYTSLWRYGEGGATGYGLSIYVISALCGNAWRESTINSGLHQVGGSAFGIFQWDGQRRENLYSWLESNGYARDSPIGQLEFLVYENDWLGSFGGISSLDEFLHSESADIPMLTEAFMRCWERPGVPELGERIAHAKECYNYILNHAQDSMITDWIIKTGYLTSAESLNNAVMLYRYYSTGGGGGTPTKEKKTMPLYLYCIKRRIEIYGN